MLQPNDWKWNAVHVHVSCVSSESNSLIRYQNIQETFMKFCASNEPNSSVPDHASDLDEIYEIKLSHSYNVNKPLQI